MNKRKWLVYGYGGFVVLLFLCFLLFVPVRMTVIKVPEPFYADIHLSTENTDVKYVSLLGVKFSAKDVYGRQTKNGQITIWSKCFQYEMKLDVVTPDETKVSYDGDAVYVGQPLDVSKFQIQAVYGDTVRDVAWFQVPTEPVAFADKVTVPITLQYGKESLSLSMIKPSQIKATYDGTPKMGDLFDASKVHVVLEYPDKTSYEISEYQLPDAPKYISDDTSIIVQTDYGNTKLQIVPENAEELKVSYNADVYVGDTLDIKDVVLTVHDKRISDFHLENIGSIKTDAEVLVSSKYGNAVLKIHPIAVKSVKANTSGELIEDSMPTIDSLQLTFEDGKERMLSGDDYEVTSLKTGLKAGKNEIWFRYHDLYLSFSVSAIPTEIVKLRKDVIAPDGGFQTYSLTSDEEKMIAIVGQRFANDDLTLIAAEVSLMANRYELYGTGSLSDYILSSGYWGMDIESYAENRKAKEDVRYLVRDILVNGHRTLPVYVDERSTVHSDTIYYQNQTVITKENGTVFCFYDMRSDVAYGYTNHAYEIYEHKTFDETEALPETIEQITVE